LEGLGFGWRALPRSGTYHYVPDHTSRDTDTLRSLCWELSINRVYAKGKEFLEKFEILDVSKICHICELKLKNKNQNDFKKEILAEINNVSTSDVYILNKVSCSEENCHETGISFVSVNSPEKDHYCIKHNLRVTATIRKQKEVIV